MFNSDDRGNFDTIFQNFVLKAQEEQNIDNPFELVSQISLWTGQNSSMCKQLCQFILNGKFEIADGKEKVAMERIVEAYLTQKLPNELQENLQDIKNSFYTRKFQYCLHEDGGKISKNNRVYLNIIKDQINLSEGQAEAVEKEQYEPYNQREENFKKYKDFYETLIQKKSEVGNTDREKLTSIQKMLNLSDRDIQSIEENTLNNKNAIVKFKLLFGRQKNINIFLVSLIFLVGLGTGGVIGFSLPYRISVRDNPSITEANTPFKIPNFKENFDLSNHLTQKDIAVNSIAFTPDGTKIVIGGQNGKLIICDLETGDVLAESPNTSNANILSIAVSPNSNEIISGNAAGAIRIWNWRTNQDRLIGEHSYQVNSIAISKNGEYIVSGDIDGLIEIWNLNDRTDDKTIVRERHPVRVNSIVLHPYLLEIVSGSSDGTLRRWDLNSGELIEIFDAGKPVFAVAVEPTGQTLFAGLEDGTIRLFKFNNQANITLKGSNSKISSLAISQNGRILVSGDNDRRVRIWDLRDQKGIQSLEEHPTYITSVAISPDNQTIITASRDKTIKVWQGEK
ncbi:MAG: WD40 repeat domain-containing protein [Cyanobacteria bacterium SBLK]|nr:WD40 repeat domain-containing protein [Cyanobacteria bacterium SBLK]